MTSASDFIKAAEAAAEVNKPPYSKEQMAMLTAVFLRSLGRDPSELHYTFFTEGLVYLLFNDRTWELFEWRSRVPAK